MKRFTLSPKKIALLFLVALYVLSPLDFIPDFVPLLGQLDDVGAIIAAIAMVLRSVPKRQSAQVMLPRDITRQ